MAAAFICEECPRALECIVCTAPFTYIKLGRGRLPRFCSETCKAKRSRRELVSKPCATCGRAFLPSRVAKASRQPAYCSLTCRPQNAKAKLYRSRRDQRRAYDHRRRAKLMEAGSERFDPAEVFDRDRWRCGICGGKVDKRLAFPHHMSVSLDHIVPLSQGGGHTMRNSQCSHWICNSRKTDGIGGQMRLFG